MPIYNAALQSLDAKETRRYAGLAKATFDEKTILAACNEAQITAKPKGIWQLYEYDASSHSILCEKPLFIKGEKIQTYLNSAKKIIVLAVTIGEEIEQMVTQYFSEGNYAYSVLLDAAATTAVESAADQMEKTFLPTMRAKGYQMKPRFSPGYGDWNLDVQPELLRLSNASAIGIHITESLMLLPRKSITAIIALTESACLLKPSSTCHDCSQKNCLARREPTV